jgi:transcriptional regulator with XRE-family HTH domain
MLPTIEKPVQMSIPMPVSVDEIGRKKSLGDAIKLCAELAGFELDKQLSDGIGVDKAQLSRWESGTEGIKWSKLERVMDKCGNDAPLLWMLYQRGYDLHTLRKRETETEKKLRLAEERIQQLEWEREHTIKVLRDVRATTL